MHVLPIHAGVQMRIYMQFAVCSGNIDYEESEQQQQRRVVDGS